VTFRRNVVVGNGTVGIAVLASPFAGLDRRVEPNPDRTRVVDNVFLHNGLYPDPLRAGDRAADERRRAETARKAYCTRLALQSAKARSKQRR
jgi:hypothetical protein